MKPKPGESHPPNEQPFHLDGAAPWFTSSDGKRWTTLSCVVLLTDGPSTVLGTLLPDFWSKSDEDVANDLNEAIRTENGARHEFNIRRAGHVVVFPQGPTVTQLSHCHTLSHTVTHNCHTVKPCRTTLNLSNNSHNIPTNNSNNYFLFFQVINFTRECR